MFTLVKPAKCFSFFFFVPGFLASSYIKCNVTHVYIQVQQVSLPVFKSRVGVAVSAMFSNVNLLALVGAVPQWPLLSCCRKPVAGGNGSATL